jgi:hypothetical protein
LYFSSLGELVKSMKYGAEGQATTRNASKRQNYD